MTFTNKAAREMRERASKLTRVSQWNLDLGTFMEPAGCCGNLVNISAGPVVHYLWLG